MTKNIGLLAMTISLKRSPLPSGVSRAPRTRSRKNCSSAFHTLLCYPIPGSLFAIETATWARPHERCVDILVANFLVVGDTVATRRKKEGHPFSDAFSTPHKIKAYLVAGTDLNCDLSL